MFTRLDGTGVELPFVHRLSPRFRLRCFCDWARGEPLRLHQIATEYLLQNGFHWNHIRILREIDGVELPIPDQFYRRFDCIQADQPRGHIPNVLFQKLLISYTGARPGQKLDRQKLRHLAALLLYENGFTTSQIASVLGWSAKGSATRAMQSARDELRETIQLN